LIETLLAIVMVGLGLMVWSRMQGASWGQNRSNANMLKGGQLIEKNIESMRLKISQNPGVYWPPKDTTFKDGEITLVRKITHPAVSPKDSKNLTNVAKVQIVASWGATTLDSIAIITYVSRKF